MSYMLKISFLLVILWSLDMANASCRETRKLCLRGCYFSDIVVNKLTISGARTDFLRQCEAACHAGMDECDIYSTPTPAQCEHFEVRCHSSCPDKVYVYANLRGILVGYSSETNANSVCKTACSTGYSRCDSDR